MGHNNPSYLLHIIFSLCLQQEERLEARHLALQKAIKQQAYQETEEKEGKAYSYI